MEDPRPHRSGPDSPRAALVLAVISAAVAACVTVWAPEPEGIHRTAAIAGAEPMGAEMCGACHEAVQEHAPSTAYHADCESCHGGGSLHMEEADPTRIRFPAAADCLACHGAGRSTHLDSASSDHQRAGVICSDCHATHNREPAHLRVTEPGAFPHMDPSSSLCVSCHADVASRLTLPSHHPVREGMIGCTDCHKPHEDRRTRLGPRTSLCADCHQDHAGPWLYEHAPVAEDCTSCHTPHGAAADALLETSQPGLCLSCHAIPDFHSPTSGGSPARYYTRCTDCHGAVHGSYENPNLLR